MEFGSFMEFPPINANGAGSGDSAAFDRALDEVEMAERVGLDAIWLAELHGAPERSVLSAPMMVASAVAARTSSIKIGIAVQVLPLSHPLRLAEEAATIDQISHGRLIYGIGRSGVVRTYEDYGVSYAESRERFAVARGDLDAGIEVDDVLPARRRVPVEVIGRLHLAEDDAGRRQPLRQFAAGSLLDPFDLDVAEMRLAARIGRKIVDPHRGISPD